MNEILTVDWMPKATHDLLCLKILIVLSNDALLLVEM